MYSYILHPLAQKEYLESVEWYLDRSEKAGNDFAKAIRNSIDKICTNPGLSPLIFKLFHEHQTGKYPFTIVYYVDEVERKIVISAIYHQKRSPQKKYRKI